MTAAVPYNQTAEEGLIGAVLVLPELIDELAARVSADDFFLVRARSTWAAILALHEKGGVIDEVALLLELAARGVGDVDLVWLTLCRGQSPDEPLAALQYADKVREYALRIRLMKAADTLRAGATNLARPVDSVVAAHVSELEALPGRANASRTLAQIYGPIFDQYGTPDTGARVPTGIAALDDRLGGGLRKRKLVIPAARPGVGKTALMLFMAYAMAQAGVQVGFVSMEMDSEEIGDRLTSLDARLPQSRLRSELSSPEKAALSRTLTRFTVTTFGSNLHLVCDGGLTMERLRALAGIWARQGVSVVFVDYIQLLESGGLFTPRERVAEVSYFSRSLKRLAMQHDLAVVAASQFSREVEKRADKKPMLSDLRETGALEQDSDVVLLLNRRGLYDEAVDPRVLDIHVAKQRAGETGMVNAWLELETGRVLPSRTVDLSGL